MTKLVMCTEANSGMRRIDLTCKTLAPFFAAIVIQFSDWAGMKCCAPHARAH